MAEKDYLYDISRLRISGSKLKSMKNHTCLSVLSEHIFTVKICYSFTENLIIQSFVDFLLWPLSDPNGLNHEYKPPIMKNKSLYINNLIPFSFSVTVHSHIYIKACFHIILFYNGDYIYNGPFLTPASHSLKKMKLETPLQLALPSNFKHNLNRNHPQNFSFPHKLSQF